AGIPIYQRVQSTYFRAPKLKSLLRGEPAWMYLAFNPRRCGTMMAIDGQETLRHCASGLARRLRQSVLRPSRAGCVTGRVPRHERAVFTFKEGWTPALAAQQKDERYRCPRLRRAYRASRSKKCNGALSPCKS